MRVLVFSYFPSYTRLLEWLPTEQLTLPLHLATFYLLLNLLVKVILVC